MTSAPSATVRSRTAAPRPRHAPEHLKRPSLRVVSHGELSPRARQRRTRLAAFAGAVVLALTVFALVASHVVLTQGQFRLDQLEARAAQEEARYERLRLEVAELESPERIVAAAQQRLGMVPPPGVTYLSPTGAAADADSGRAGGDGTAPSDETAAGTTGWSVVKPQLAARP